MAFLEDSKAKECRVTAACGVTFLVIVTFSSIATGLKSPQPKSSGTDRSPQSGQDAQAHLPDQLQDLDQMTQQAKRGEQIDLKFR